MPIDETLPEIIAAVEKNACVVVEAPPGAGKTTRVAPALLRQLSQLAEGGKVVLVQPRRIAARATASRIAEEMNTHVGGLVGYQVRFERSVGADTRLIAMTPGILLRQLQSDVALSDTAVVILDEFHERSLEYDLLLGMLCRIQTELRPELRLVIMSATLNTQSICEYLRNPPVIRVEGHLHPVTVHYNRFGVRGKLTDLVADKVIEAASEHDGDILVFLPGVGEIEQVARQIEPRAARDNWEVLRLFGEMSSQDQDRALQPNVRRKIILATNIAETSLTIDGVRVVVDSGWVRVQRVDPHLGLNCLELEPISKASAVQRAGRAGRTAPGVCYRVWDETTHRTRTEHLEPEILRVDLSGAVLQLLCWGEPNAADFPWVTAPRESAIANATQLLERIDAIAGGRATGIGRRLIQIPVHPRLARLLLEGHTLGIPRSASLAAAMLSERDVFDRNATNRSNSGGPRQPFTRAQQNHACDVTQRLSVLIEFLSGGFGGRHRSEASHHGLIVKPAAARQVERVAEQLERQLLQLLGEVPEEQLDDQLQQALLPRSPIGSRVDVPCMTLEV